MFSDCAGRFIAINLSWHLTASVHSLCKGAAPPDLVQARAALDWELALEARLLVCEEVCRLTSQDAARRLSLVAAASRRSGTCGAVQIWTGPSLGSGIFRDITSELTIAVRRDLRTPTRRQCDCEGIG